MDSVWTGATFVGTFGPPFFIIGFTLLGLAIVNRGKHSASDSSPPLEKLIDDNPFDQASQTPDRPPLTIADEDKPLLIRKLPARIQAAWLRFNIWTTNAVVFAGAPDWRCWSLDQKWTRIVRFHCVRSLIVGLCLIFFELGPSFSLFSFLGQLLPIFCLIYLLVKALVPCCAVRAASVRLMGEQEARGPCAMNTQLALRIGAAYYLCGVPILQSFASLAMGMQLWSQVDVSKWYLIVMLYLSVLLRIESLLAFRQLAGAYTRVLWLTREAVWQFGDANDVRLIAKQLCRYELCCVIVAEIPMDDASLVPGVQFAYSTYDRELRDRRLCFQNGFLMTTMTAFLLVMLIMVTIIVAVS